MKIECMSTETSKLTYSGLCICPEAFDTIDMRYTRSKFIVSMVNSKMFFIPQVDKAVIPSPPIRMDDCHKVNAAAYNCLERASRTIGNNFCVNKTVSFEDTKNDSFSIWAAASLSLNSTSAEVTFINLNLTRKWGLLLTIISNSLSNCFEITVNSIAI